MVFLLALELDKWRKEQADRVMPAVGALLDAWENTPNDVLSDLQETCPNLCELIAALRTAAEG